MTVTEQNFKMVGGKQAGPWAAGRICQGRSGPAVTGGIPKSAIVAFLLGILGFGAAACGPRRLNVMQTPDQTLMTVGYSAERSQSIFRAENEAQLYCQRKERTVVLLKEDTVYQGHYNEEVTSAARAAGRVADALGNRETGRASRALSSPTDYKTTFEFLCR